jgi:AraC-like DNA-binding protein
MLNLQVMADRFPRIVIQCLNGNNALHSAHYNCIYAASLKGVTSKPALFQMEPVYSHVAVSFFPHGVKALFGIDAFETIDSVLDLHHFFPNDIVEKIINARETKTRISVLDNYLLKKLSQMKAVDSRVVNFLQLCPSTRYGHLLKDYGISERNFERKFLQSVGFTPSYYKRVVRFEKAHVRIQQGDYTSLSNLAYELGYADQSHFNRDFKELSGSTPLSLSTKDELVAESGSLLGE